MGSGMKSMDLGLAHTLEPAGSLFVATDSSGSQMLRLSDSYLFVFIARGEVSVAADRSEMHLRARDALLLHHSASRAIVFHYGSGAEFYALKFKEIQHASRGTDPPLFIPARGSVCSPERLTDLLRRYISEQRRRGSTPWALYNLLVLILCEFSAAAGGSLEARPVSSGLETIASMVDAYIAAHYREAISAIDVAQELRYSPGYLERTYRRERGISVRSAIHLRRIREARAQLLLQRETRVSEIAAQCGYADVAYFRRVFKRTTNMTPVSFRTTNSGRAVGDFTRTG